MGGYTIKKKVKFPIKGSDGTMYFLPDQCDLSFEDVSFLAEYNKTEDVVKRGELCKNFILKYCPGLDNDPEIGDGDFIMIFDTYNKSAVKLGE